MQQVVEMQERCRRQALSLTARPANPKSEIRNPKSGSGGAAILKFISPEPIFSSAKTKPQPAKAGAGKPRVLASSADG
jgi:hypothetical protein